MPPMKERNVLLAIAVIVAIATLAWLIAAISFRREEPAPPRNGPAPQARPNIVLISLDTLRPDHLGCYGYSRDTSPNIDRLARDGVLFRRCWSQAPWTLPSHMSLFTSMLPSHNGVEDLNQALPEDIPLLAQILQENGYQTAAIVNNGQMKPHWGFSRGFDLWREFPVDTPEGDCENITEAALTWLDSETQKPFFLFLHYFDVHEPYEAAKPFREQLGVTLTGPQTRRIMWEARLPEKGFGRPEQKEQVIRAYDAEIAWMDSQLGRLFERIPTDSLVVLFSDHGEAFEEHGWTLHGAALYEEEVRTALVMRFPGDQSGGKGIEAPVMLLDVAPTILAACGIARPDHYEGENLLPVVAGDSLPVRPIMSETKRVLEGTVRKMVMLHPWKLIYSLFDGSTELYRIPEEQTELSEIEAPRTEVLSRLVRNWVSEEHFLMVYAKGKGRYEATVQPRGGKLSVFIPINCEMGRDNLDLFPEGKGLRWTAYPRGETKALYVEVAPDVGELSLDFTISEEKRRDLVFLDPSGSNPETLPFAVRFGGDRSGRSPVITEPFEPKQDGVHVVRYGKRTGASRTASPIQLDAETLRQLRSLGYVQ